MSRETEWTDEFGHYHGAPDYTNRDMAQVIVGTAITVSAMLVAAVLQSRFGVLAGLLSLIFGYFVHVLPRGIAQGVVAALCIVMAAVAWVFVIAAVLP